MWQHVFGGVRHVHRSQGERQYFVWWKMFGIWRWSLIKGTTVMLWLMSFLSISQKPSFRRKKPSNPGRLWGYLVHRTLLTCKTEFKDFSLSKWLFRKKALLIFQRWSFDLRGPYFRSVLLRPCILVFYTCFDRSKLGSHSDPCCQRTLLRLGTLKLLRALNLIKRSCFQKRAWTRRYTPEFKGWFLSKWFVLKEGDETVKSSLRA